MARIEDASPVNERILSITNKFKQHIVEYRTIYAKERMESNKQKVNTTSDQFWKLAQERSKNIATGDNTSINLQT